MVYDLFPTNCTAIVCNDVLKTNFACIRKWPYPSVNDTENCDRNTEPGIPLKYGDIRSRRPYLVVYGRKRAWTFDLGNQEQIRLIVTRATIDQRSTGSNDRIGTRQKARIHIHHVKLREIAVFETSQQDSKYTLSCMNHTGWCI